MKRKADMGLAILILLAVFAGYRLWEPDEVGEERPAAVAESASGMAVTNPAETRGKSAGPTKPARTSHSTLPPSVNPVSPFDETAMESLMVSFAELMTMRAEKIPAFLRQRLDAALEGDLEAAFEAREMRSRCMMVPTDPQRLEARIEVFSRAGRDALEKYGVLENEPGDEPGHLFPTDKETRAHQTRWYRSCQEVRQLYEDDYRARVESLAREGHVVSRYLYAMWPPSDGLRMTDFLNKQHWLSLAQRFSMDNLEAGEPAGMLAYAQAYSSIDSFLPMRAVNDARAIAFYLAALDCGFADERIASSVSLLVSLSLPNAQSEDHPNEEQARELAAVLALAEDIKALCR